MSALGVWRLHSACWVEPDLTDTLAGCAWAFESRAKRAALHRRRPPGPACTTGNWNAQVQQTFPAARMLSTRLRFLQVVDNKVPLKVALAYTAAHGPAPRLVPSQRSRSPDISPVAHETPAPDVIAHVASADAEAAAVRLLQLALAHGRGGAQTRCPPVSSALRAPDTVKTGASLLAWPCGRAGSSTSGAGGLRSFRVPDVPGATEDLSGGDAGRVDDVHAPSPRDVHWCVVTGQPRAPATARAGSSALEKLLPWPATVAHLLDAQGLLVVMQDKVEDRGCGPVPQLMLSTTAMTATALDVPLTGASPSAASGDDRCTDVHVCAVPRSWW